MKKTFLNTITRCTASVENAVTHSAGILAEQYISDLSDLFALLVKNLRLNGFVSSPRPFDGTEFDRRAPL